MTIVYDLTVPPDLTVPHDLAPPPVVLDLTPPADLAHLTSDDMFPPSDDALPPADLAHVDGHAPPVDLAMTTPSHDAGALDLASDDAHDLSTGGATGGGMSGSGCGCDVGGRSPAAPPLTLALIFVALLFRRRRA
jgi:MYXO-CTERM domain-containing protein